VPNPPTARVVIGTRPWTCIRSSEPFAALPPQTRRTKKEKMSDFHGTTILCVRRDGKVAVGGDGQVTMGNQVMKGNARKVRRLRDGSVLAGFAGGTADAFTL